MNNSESFNNSPKSDNETAKSPLEDMPSFEEFREMNSPLEDVPSFEGFREMNWSNSVGNYNNVQPAPEGQPAPEEQLISEKTDSSVAEEKRKTPENTDNRHEICSGEKSALYNTEGENGKTGIRLESEYFDIANNFYASNKEKLKKYRKTKEAVTELSFDLALIDATHGKNFEKNDEKGQERLLENYSVLRSRLDDENTGLEEKGLIREYLEETDGKAQRFLKEKYEKATEQKESEKEKEQEKEKTQARIIEEFLRGFNAMKANLKENESEVDRIANEIDEMLESKSVTIDTDELSGLAIKLKNRSEDLCGFANRLNKKNEEYEVLSQQYKNRTGRDLSPWTVATIDKTNTEIRLARAKADEMAEKADKIRRMVEDLEGMPGF